MRTTIKEDLKCTPSELVYGQTIRVPGEMICHSEPEKISNYEDFVKTLRDKMNSLKPTPPRKTQKKVQILPDLKDCDYVFVRVDKVRVGLEPPYEGPYKVVRKFRKNYLLDVKGKNKSISLDRLKPAFGI